jgi:hypothetical protein
MYVPKSCAWHIIDEASGEAMLFHFLCQPGGPKFKSWAVNIRVHPDTFYLAPDISVLRANSGIVSLGHISGGHWYTAPETFLEFWLCVRAKVIRPQPAWTVLSGTG